MTKTHECFACRMGLPWPCRCNWKLRAAVVLVVLIGLALTGCGGPCGYKHVVRHGRVYAVPCKR